jgi:glycosyltransferase involved in cell wall biosynthesis
MIDAGLRAELMHVKPNSYFGTPTRVRWEDRRDAAIFVGRLAPEKGVLHVVNAWIRMGADAPELRIIGDGELLSDVRDVVRANAARNIKVFGPLPTERAIEEIGMAKLLVVASTGYEGLPLVVRDAFAAGTPVAVSDAGPLPEIVQHGAAGLIFESRNELAIARTVQQGWSNEDAMKAMADRAFEIFREQYMEDPNYRRLIGIYEAALGRAASVEKRH